MDDGRLAQPEERFPYKEEAGGSSPSAPTIAPTMEGRCSCAMFATPSTFATLGHAISFRHDRGLQVLDDDLPCFIGLKRLEQVVRYGIVMVGSQKVPVDVMEPGNRDLA